MNFTQAVFWLRNGKRHVRLYKTFKMAAKQFDRLKADPANYLVAIYDVGARIELFRRNLP